MKNITLCIYLLLATCQCYANGLGQGKLGNASISGVVNQYAAVYSCTNNSPWVTEFWVDTASGFTAGDLVLIIQMQGATADLNNNINYGNISSFAYAGNFEYGYVVSVTGNSVRTTKTKKTYDVKGKIQLVKVPEYTSVHITGELTGMPWNGEKGGIIAIDAKDSIVLNDVINADGLGFRGGVAKKDITASDDNTNYVENNGLNAMKGEGIAGRGDNGNIYGRGKIANGGGGGNNHNAGGAGGGNAGCGGMGGWGFYSYQQPESRGIGGASLVEAINGGMVFMGGGAGAGQVNDAFLSVAGNGGGIIILTTERLTCDSQMITASGTDGTDINGYDGAAGGGAGGSILLYANKMTNLNLVCKGGKGGNPANFQNQHLTAPGGGGGGGLIRTKIPVFDVVGNVLTTDSGASGTCDGSKFGATDGCKGLLIESLNIVNSPLSIETYNKDAFVANIYPNPTTDYITITLPAGHIKNNTALIYDMNGKQCVHITFDGNQKKLDTKHLPPGMYFLKVTNKNGVSITKVVK